MTRPHERLNPDPALPLRWEGGEWRREGSGRPPEALHSGMGNEPAPPEAPQGRLARIVDRLLRSGVGNLLR